MSRSVEADRLHLEVSGIGGDREDAEGVRVPETALPPLDGNDRRAGLDDVERKRIPETEPDTVVDLV